MEIAQIYILAKEQYDRVMKKKELVQSLQLKERVADVTFLCNDMAVVEVEFNGSPYYLAVVNGRRVGEMSGSFDEAIVMALSYKMSLI